MKHFTLSLLAILALSASSAFAQIVIQHTGATDPVTEGFTLIPSGDVQLSPVSGDLGFDSWVIHSRDHNEAATYFDYMTLDELQAATTDGWTLSANMRFVELSDFTLVSITFHTGMARFRLIISAIDGEIVVSGDDIQPFSLEGDALGYHEYTFAYEPASETAALWIDGLEWVSGISGGQITTQPGLFAFGAGGEGITYSHWNDVTLAVVPEPATVALLTGLGALLVAGTVRRRRRDDRAV